MNDKQSKQDKPDRAKEALSFALKKTADWSKKTSVEIQKNAQLFSEQRKQVAHDKKIKRYNPLFADNFKNEGFKLPNIIQIVDDAIRREIEVCDGAIGWTDKINEVEILHLYDEFIEESNIQFIPFPKCDAVYCVDNFERNKFINVQTAFERVTNEKLAELEHIAYCLGAKSCSIEIVETDSKKSMLSLSGSASYKLSANISHSTSSTSANSQHGKNISLFEGNNITRVPTLKWFFHDENIKGLIDMRCADKNSIKSKILEIKCSSSETMSQKTACAIDSLLNIKAAASFEKQFMKEHNSKLVFEIEF